MATYIVRKNNVISMVRGDSFSFNLDINKELGVADSEAYTLTENDKLYFALMYPNSTLGDAILIKEYTSNDLNSDGTVTIAVNPDDTVLLEPGTYYYTVKLGINIDTENEEVHTIIPNTKFFIID